MESPFQVHLLNADGIDKAQRLQHIFEGLLIEIQSIAPKSRELSLVITKLEEASFFAKKAMAQDPANQLHAPLLTSRFDQ